MVNNFKSFCERYITNKGKLYISWWHLYNWVDGKPVFPDSGKPNTKEARAYMLSEHPDCTDYVLKRSDAFFWYEVFVELEYLNSCFPGRFTEKELAQYRIKANSRAKLSTSNP